MTVDIPSYGWATVAVVGVAFVIEVARRIWTGRDEVSRQRARLKRELRAALAEGRLTDAQRLRLALKALGCLLVAFCLAGCVSKPLPPIIVGERILLPKPGDVLTVPALTPPARTWYLVDDVGLAGWLGLDLDGDDN